VILFFDMLKHYLIFITPLALAACGQTNSNTPTDKSAEPTTTLTKSQKLDTASFWKIMDNAFARGKFNNSIREQAILDQLTKLTPEQIREFEIIFQQMNAKASTWSNLAAVTIIEGGASDDGFFYFRCWLISLGKNNFDETLKNPDHLAAIDIPFDTKNKMTICEFEELIPISDRAYEIVTRKDPMTDTTFPRVSAQRKGLFYDSGPELSGIEWESNAELPKIAPLLYKKYLGK